MRAAAFAFALMLAPCGATPAAAHKASDSRLQLTVAAASVEGQWDLALRDLEAAVGIDLDEDGAITWGELRARRDAVAAHAFARLELAADGRRCRPLVTQLLFDRHSDGGYAVLRFATDCPRPRSLSLRYTFLFDVDPLHRGLLTVRDGERAHAAMLSPDAPAFSLAVGAAPDLRAQLLAYLAAGAWHIWLGFDHVLFLLSLLLPAVLRREGGRWRPLGHLGEAARAVVGIVTAFTAAHSLTLVLAATGQLALPSRLVEAAIAASIVAAALNNLFPLVEQHLWRLGFAFGLIHGVGFAGALADLGLPARAELLSLGAFNLGVELGQLAIVAAILPAAFALRETWLYPRLVLRAGSVAIAALGCVWLLERGLNLILL